MESEKAQPDHTLFRSIQQDVTNLHLYWMVYRQLYAQSEQRIALLNETGSLVFYVLQSMQASLTARLLPLYRCALKRFRRWQSHSVPGAIEQSLIAISQRN